MQISSRKLKEKLQENYQKSDRKLLWCLPEEKIEMPTDGAAVTISKPEYFWFHEDLMVDRFKKT